MQEHADKDATFGVVENPGEEDRGANDDDNGREDVDDLAFHKHADKEGEVPSSVEGADDEGGFEGGMILEVIG